MWVKHEKDQVQSGGLRVFGRDTDICVVFHRPLLRGAVKARRARKVKTAQHPRRIVARQVWETAGRNRRWSAGACFA